MSAEAGLHPLQDGQDELQWSVSGGRQSGGGDECEEQSAAGQTTVWNTDISSGSEKIFHAKLFHQITICIHPRPLILTSIFTLEKMTATRPGLSPSTPASPTSGTPGTSRSLRSPAMELLYKLLQDVLR